MYRYNKMRRLKLYFIFILLVLLAISQEAEARRKILRGRKTLTRWYMRKSVIPAWAVVILVALGQLTIGGLLYMLLKTCILDKPITPRYKQVFDESSTVP